MKTHITWCCQTICVLFSILLAGYSSTSEAQSIKWYSNLAEAQLAAQKENKLVLLHFQTDWCRPCKDLDRFVFNSTRVVKVFQANVIAVRVDADDADQLVKNHGVTSVPFDVVMTPKGRVILRRKSPRDSESYVQMIDRLGRVLNLLAAGKEPALNQNLDELQKLMEVEKAAFASERDKLMPDKPQLMQVRPSSFSSNLKRKYQQPKDDAELEESNAPKTPAKVVANPFFGNGTASVSPKRDSITPPVGVVNTQDTELKTNVRQKMKSNEFYPSTSPSSAPATPNALKQSSASNKLPSKAKVVINNSFESNSFGKTGQFMPPQPPDFDGMKDPFQKEDASQVSDNQTASKASRQLTKDEPESDNQFQPSMSSNRIPAKFVSQKTVQGAKSAISEDNSFQNSTIANTAPDQLEIVAKETGVNLREIPESTTEEVADPNSQRDEFNFDQEVLLGTKKNSHRELKVDSMVWSATESNRQSIDLAQDNELTLRQNSINQTSSSPSSKESEKNVSPKVVSESGNASKSLVATGELKPPANPVPTSVQAGKFNPVTSTTGTLVGTKPPLAQPSNAPTHLPSARKEKSGKFVQAGFKRVKKEPVSKTPSPSPAVIGFVRVHSSSESTGATSAPIHTPQLETDDESKYALKGMCPVTLLTKGEWVEGDAKIGCVHRERVYLFVNKANRDLFLSDPDRYSPVLAGYDPVVYLETGALQLGNEANGVFMGKKPNQRIVLFQSVETRDQFKASPAKYLDGVRKAMDRN